MTSEAWLLNAKHEAEKSKSCAMKYRANCTTECSKNTQSRQCSLCLNKYGCLDSSKQQILSECIEKNKLKNADEIYAACGSQQELKHNIPYYGIMCFIIGFLISAAICMFIR